MANISRVFGFRPVKHLNGSCYNGQANIYEFAAGETVPVFIGDAVLRSTEASTSGLITVKSLSAHATDANNVTSGIVQGVVVGIVVPKLDPLTGKMSTGSMALDTPTYLPAGTKGYVLVSDSPDTVYEIQSTAAFTQALVGSNCDVGVLAVSGNQTTTGASGMYINATTPDTTGTRPCKMIGHVQRVDNEQAAAYNKVLVVFSTHAFGNAVAGV